MTNSGKALELDFLNATTLKQIILKQCLSGDKTFSSVM